MDNKYLDDIIEMKFKSYTNKQIIKELKISEYTLKKCNKIIKNTYFEYINFKNGGTARIKDIIPYDVQLYTYIKYKECEVSCKIFQNIFDVKLSMKTLRTNKNNLFIYVDYLKQCEDHYSTYKKLTPISSNIPTSSHCIYRFIDINNEVVYIGKTTTSLKTRLSNHLHLSKECYDNIHKIQYIELQKDNDLLLEFIERYLISQYTPKYNIDYNKFQKFDYPIDFGYDLENWIDYEE